MVVHHTDGTVANGVGSSSRKAPSYDVVVASPPVGDSWCELSPEPLPSGEVLDWVSRPDCGAVVTFTGLVRDHSRERPAVSALTYEAYESQAVARLEAVEAEVRQRWPSCRRIALIHRVGELVVGDTAVVVAVSAPHRDAAFEAARFAIDELKATVPIWKHETWEGGSSWGLEAQHLRGVGSHTA